MIFRCVSGQGSSARRRKSFSRSGSKLLVIFRQIPDTTAWPHMKIEDLTRKYGIKIFQSYLESKTPAAGRMFWAYGPDKGDITVLAVEPHPEDAKRGAYERIRLASMPRRRT